MNNISEAVWLGCRIREETKNANKTANQVSQATGIPWSTYRRKLMGVTSFSWNELLRIAEVLHVPPSTFTPPAFKETTAA